MSPSVAQSNFSKVVVIANSNTCMQLLDTNSCSNNSKYAWSP